MGRTKDLLVYGLIDPRDQQLRYVGLSSSGLYRPQQHGKGKRRNTPVSCWAHMLKDKGLVYEIEVLERASAYPELVELERFWIAYFRFVGCGLLNLTSGGEGVPGLRFSRESRSRMGESQKKRFDSPESRETHSTARKKYFAETPGALEKHGEAARKYYSDNPLAREANRALRVSYFEDPAARERTSVARGGKHFFDAKGNEYATQQEAAQCLGILQSNISSVLRGRSSHVRGFMFTYKPPPSKR